MVNEVENQLMRNVYDQVMQTLMDHVPMVTIFLFQLGLIQELVPVLIINEESMFQFL